MSNEITSDVFKSCIQILRRKWVITCSRGFFFWVYTWFLEEWRICISIHLNFLIWLCPHLITLIISLIDLERATFNFNYQFKIIYFQATKKSVLNFQDHRLFNLYNNTPSKAIVNAASNITYRPLIEAVDTGRCTLIIWPIFGTRLISFT